MQATQHALTAAAQIIHVGQPGESLSSIGRLYGVTYEAMMGASGLIELGQDLITP